MGLKVRWIIEDSRKYMLNEDTQRNRSILNKLLNENAYFLNICGMCNNLCCWPIRQKISLDYTEIKHVKALEMA